LEGAVLENNMITVDEVAEVEKESNFYLFFHLVLKIKYYSTCSSSPIVP
jgi:hypothetical protein